jgi:lysophospholipase L1-like esterase
MTAISGKRKLATIAVALAAALAIAPRAAAGPAATLAAGARADDASAIHYYVALGDSLAEGDQPNGEVGQGYADQLYAALKTDDHTLQLENLACGGETTSSMINGVEPTGRLGSRYFCAPPGPRRERLAHGSQLADAVAFLRAHSQFVSLITIDIGGNDVGLCVYQLDQACLADALTAVEQNLTVIVSALRDAAPDVPIVGMNYYDPFLAFWFGDPTAAQRTEQMVVQFNRVLGSVYGAGGAPVADVETAFSTTDWTPVSGIPLNVLRICQWTWMCDAAYGPDLHANTAGYGEIAHAFLDVLKP